MTQIARQPVLHARAHRHFPRSHRLPATLRRCTGTIRSVDVTPDGHAACVIETPAGRLHALSDATKVHLPELRSGRELRVVLLHIRRRTLHGSWDWQLMACNGIAGLEGGLPADASAAKPREGARQ